MEQKHLITFVFHFKNLTFENEGKDPNLTVVYPIYWIASQSSFIGATEN